MRNAVPLDLKGFGGISGNLGGRSVVLMKTGIGLKRARDTASRTFEALPDIEVVAITGVAGALDHRLKLGGIVLAERLITRREESFHPDRVIKASPEPLRNFASALESRRLDYATGGILTSRRAIVTVAEKQLAAAQSGALAVDMESAVIADEAHLRGLPFVCLRTILDTANDELAGAALADENGRVRPLVAARTVVTNPSMLIGAARLIRNLRTSTRALATAMESVLLHLE
jgi:adenosylhomocysteine nucleosidase